MSKKHFNLIAANIRRISDSITPDCPEAAAKRFGVLYTAEAVADACAVNNPNFDRARFLAACGLGVGSK